MEMNTIRSPELQVVISPLSAELMSIKDSDGVEYLWQGSSPYWNRRAINLFPYIGRLTDGSYLYNGKLYKMNIHGFLPDSIMTVESASESSVCFFLQETRETLESYPFSFELRISYALAGTKIDISFYVHNTGNERMFFGIGGHPGFNVPLEQGLTFGDYCIEFTEKCTPMLVGMSEKCFPNGLDTDFPLPDGKTIPLSHELFDNDAIILQDACREVTLKSNKGRKSLAVASPGMPYIGFWHDPKTEAPFVCIEPWTSLPSRDGVVEDIARQPGLIGLEPGDRYINKWSITICRVR